MAVLLLNESFEGFAPGEAHGQNGWSNGLGTVAGEAVIIDTTSSNLSYTVPDTGLTINGGVRALQVTDLSDTTHEVLGKDFGPYPTDPTSTDTVIYVRFLARIATNASFLASSDDVMVNLIDVAAPAWRPEFGLGGSYGARGNNRYWCGMDDSGSYSTYGGTTNYAMAPGQTHMVVGRLSKPGGSNATPAQFSASYLWVDPRYGDSATPVATATWKVASAAYPKTFNRVLFSVLGSLDAGDLLDLDALVVGEKWEDVFREPPRTHAGTCFRIK